jgi:hypothetical protein
MGGSATFSDRDRCSYRFVRYARALPEQTEADTVQRAFFKSKSLSISPTNEGVLNMSYQKPDFTEIKMDAEIGSYQDDFSPLPDDPRFTTPGQSPSVPGDGAAARD